MHRHLAITGVPLSGWGPVMSTIGEMLLLGGGLLAYCRVCFGLCGQPERGLQRVKALDA
jgi:hypothetical protein